MSVPPPAHRIFRFTLEEIDAPRCLMPKKKLSINWQLTPCSQDDSKNNEQPKKNVKSLRQRKDCHEEDGACTSESYQNLIMSQMPKMKNITEQLTKTHDKERCEIRLNPQTAHARFGKSLSETERGPLLQQCNSVTFRSEISTEFVLATDPQGRLCEGVPPCRLHDVRKKTSKTQGSYLAASINTKLRTRQHQGQTSKQEVQS